MADLIHSHRTPPKRIKASPPQEHIKSSQKVRNLSTQNTLIGLFSQSITYAPTRAIFIIFIRRLCHGEH